MTDQNSQFFAILTAVGEAKQTNASALGTSWTFAQMAVGDANETAPIPNRLQTKLINERRRAPLNQVKVDPTNPSVIIAEQIIPESAGGWWVRELALYDADGDMVAIANCAPTYKPLLSQGSGRTQVIRINLIVSSTANIELKIDPSVVLATREYVDTSVIEALAKLDFKHSVLVATTANTVLSGSQTIDGVLVTEGARVLVKDQALAKDNGIYVLPASGAWKRAQDADSSAEVTPGLFVSVEKGTANSDSVWQLVTDGPITLGTTALAFEMVAGKTGVLTGTYKSVTVDKYGRIIGGTNPDTLAGYGIKNAYTAAEVDAIAALKANLAITLAGYGIADAFTKLETAAAITAAITALDPWALQPIGVPIPVMFGAGEPPTNKAYRYIKLTAADPYNAGVLTGEVVIGVAPLVVAYGRVSLASSPINGNTVYLLNTERRSIRPGTAGTLQDDAIQNVTGAINGSFPTASSGGVTPVGAFNFQTSNFQAGASVAGMGMLNLTFDASRVARTSDETRTKNIGANFYMRVS